jgi:hypothetical protein
LPESPFHRLVGDSWLAVVNPELGIAGHWPDGFELATWKILFKWNGWFFNDVWSLWIAIFNILKKGSGAFRFFMVDLEKFGWEFFELILFLIFAFFDLAN